MKIETKKGSALVELAIVLPLLLLLVFGAIEFGRAMYMQNTLNYAAREGARRAAVSNPFDIGSIQSYVTSSVPATVQTGMAVSVTPASPTHHVTTVTVTVTRPFSTAVPLIIPGLSGITLTGQASMLYE